MAVPVVVCGLALAVAAGRAGLEGLAAGVVGVVACLLSPVSWEHHWVWVLPCLTGLSALARTLPERRMIGVAAGGFLIGAQEMPRGLQTSWPPITTGTSWLLANLFVTTAIVAVPCFCWSALRESVPVPLSSDMSVAPAGDRS